MKAIFHINKTAIIISLWIMPGNPVFAQELTPQQFDSLLVDILCIPDQSSDERTFEEGIKWNEMLLAKAAKQHYPKGMIWAHINMANEYFANGQFGESIKQLNAAKKISTGNRIDYYTLGRLEEQYSLAYYGMQLFDRSLASNQKAIAIGNKIEDSTIQSQLLFRLYANRANSFYDIDQPDSAIICLRKSLTYENTPYALASIASHFIEVQPDLDSAKIYLDRAYKLIEKTVVTAKDNEYGIVHLYYGLLYNTTEQYDSAVYHYKKSISYAEKKKNYLTLLSSYELLAETYKALNNKEKENEYMAKLLGLKKKLEEAQAQGVELTLEDIHQDKIRESKRLKKNFWVYGGIIFVTGIIIFIYLYLENRRKNRKIITQQEQVISRKEEEAEDLKRRLSEAPDELIQLVKKNDTGFFTKFQEVYPELSSELLKINPRLTQSDLAFCAMIWLGFSSKDIANYTFIQHRSVQSKKGRLRKKLSIDSETDLYMFFRTVFGI